MPIRLAPTRRGVVATALALALTVLGVLAAGPAGAAAVEESQPEGDEPCIELVDVVEHEYRRLVDPGTEDTIQKSFRFDKWGGDWVKIGLVSIWVPKIVETAWFPLPWDLEEAFWTAVDLYESEGWVFNATSLLHPQVTVIPGEPPTYETAWFVDEPDPAEGWEPTGDSRDAEQAVEVECPPEEPETPGPGTPTDTVPPAPDPEPDDEPTEVVETTEPGPEVGGIDAGVAGAGAEAAPARAVLPRTGAGVATPLLGGLALLGTGLGLVLTARRRA